MNFMGPVVYAPTATSAALRRSSSGPAAMRKRAMPGSGIVGDASRLSFAARKSESDKDLLGALAPLGLVFMEQVALDIDVLREPHTEVKYVLKVRHLKTHATWTHARPFDDYRRFQHRVLKALNHGHFCSAECPWLFTFLKSYFPKKHLFSFATSRVVASRKDALQKFFVSLQGFLLNRANHNCRIIATAVVDAVVEFVYGDYAKYYQLQDTGATTATTDNQQQHPQPRGGSFCLNKTVLRGSDCSPRPEDDETSTASASSSCGTAALSSLSSSASSSAVCLLCVSSLEGEAYAASRSCASIVTTSSALTSTASSTSLMSDDSPMDTADMCGAMSTSAPANLSALAAAVASGRRGTHYVMTLGCGHQFHDECIVPKLNETLRCPTCDHLEVK